MTASEFVAESIEMKKRWLARQFRRTNATAEIEQWVKVVTILEISYNGLKGIVRAALHVLKDRAKKPWESTFLNISAPHALNLKGIEVGRDIMGNPSTEEEGKIPSMEVEVGENKTKKNIVEETKGESRNAKSRKIGSIDNDELLRLKKRESVKERKPLNVRVILSGAVHKEKISSKKELHWRLKVM